MHPPSTAQAAPHAAVKQGSSTAKVCGAFCQDGRPCGARPLPGSPWCLWHDPSKGELRDAARRAGGVQRARQIKAATAPVDLGDLAAAWSLRDREDLAECRADVARALRTGRIAGKDASALNVILDSFSADLDKLADEAPESGRGRSR